MRTRMNFTVLGDPKHKDQQTKVTVYTQHIEGKTYRVRIMLGENEEGPRGAPWKTGTATKCKSHEQAADAAIKWTSKILNKRRTY